MRLQPLTVFNYSIKNQSEDAIDIFIDGDIVDSPTKEILQKYFGDETSTSFKSFREQIPANTKTINLYVNSGGGHVGDALAMHDYMKDLESKGVTVNRYGRGIVASAATYLVMGNNSNMSENSWFMIHNVSGFAYGDVNQVENQAKTMRKFNDRIVNFYADQTGLSRTVIGNMMNSETWLTAQEAKDKGFVNAVTGKVEFTNQIKEELWPFKNMAVLNSYNSFTKNSTDMKKEIMDAITNGFNSLLEKIGMKDKAGDENVKNAFTEFSTSISNAIEKGGLGEDKVKELINSSITEIFNKIGENESFKTATQNFLTKEAIENMATKKDLENVVTNESLGKKLTETKDEIVNAVAEKLGNGGGGKKKEDENKKKKVPGNRFSGVDWANYN